MGSHSRFFISCAIAAAVVAGATLQAATLHAGLPQPGERPTAPETQVQLGQARRTLEAALLEKDETRIYAAARRYQEALGDYAGVPEDREQYVLPLVTTRPVAVGAKFASDFNATAQTDGSRSQIAQSNQMELREAGYLALGCMRAAVAVGKDSPEGKRYLERAHAELDYLLSRQHSQGFFPYPAQPSGNAPPNMRAAMERYRKEFPQAVRDGFAVLPPPDGGFQFDTGVCGVALSEGFELLHHSRYRDAARGAADWALTQNLVRNWNYNAFSVWLLARTFSVTGERKYLASALQKAQLGVLPGQMTGEQGQEHWPGRWMDQHNAKRTYHWGMLRALNALLQVLPKDSHDYESIRQRVFLASDCRADDTLRDGPIASESAVVALAELLEQFGPRDKWEQALHAEVHAFVQTKKIDLYALGAYLRYARRKQ